MANNFNDYYHSLSNYINSLISPHTQRRHTINGSPICLDFIHEDEHKKMLKTAYDAITQLELWDWITDEEPEAGFMFSNDPNIRRIYNKIEELGYSSHSGSSFAMTIRQIQFLARYGIDTFRQEYLNNYRPPVNILPLVNINFNNSAPAQ